MAASVVNPSGWTSHMSGLSQRFLDVTDRFLFGLPRKFVAADGRRKGVVMLSFACLMLSFVINNFLLFERMPEMHARLTNSTCDFPGKAVLNNELFGTSVPWSMKWTLWATWLIQIALLLGSAMVIAVELTQKVSKVAQIGNSNTIRQLGIFASSHIGMMLLAVHLGFMAHYYYYDKPRTAYDAAESCYGTFSGHRWGAYTSTMAGISIIASGMYIIGISTSYVVDENSYAAIVTAIAETLRVALSKPGKRRESRRGREQHLVNDAINGNFAWKTVHAAHAIVLALFVCSFICAGILWAQKVGDINSTTALCIENMNTTANPIPEWVKREDSSNGYISASAVFWLSVILSAWAIVTASTTSNTWSGLGALVASESGGSWDPVVKQFRQWGMAMTGRVVLEVLLLLFWARLLLQSQSHYLVALFSLYGCTGEDYSPNTGGRVAWFGFAAIAVGSALMEFVEAHSIYTKSEDSHAVRYEAQP